MSVTALVERVSHAGQVDDVVATLRRPIAGALRSVLVPLYAGGWAAGEDAATDVLRRRGLISADSAVTPRSISKADGDDVTLELAADWESWDAGDLEAAGIVDGDGLLRLLADAVGRTAAWSERAAARGSLIASMTDGRLDQLAAVLTEQLAAGASPDAIERAIIDVLDDTSWADMVAVTEVARAVTAATLATYAANGIEGKEFLTAADDRVCPECSANEDEGGIPLYAVFPYGDPPSHPNCRCALLPVTLTLSDLAAGEDFDMEATA